MTIHPNDHALLHHAEVTAYRLAVACGANLVTVEPKRRPLSDGALGVCYCDEGRIGIVLRFKHRVSDGGAWYKRPLPLDMVMRTVAHEVAHLLYPQHGSEFKALELQLRSII